MMRKGKDIKNNPVECLRCGTCCRQGGPALHDDDLQLIKNGVLPFSQLITVRRDEPAHNPLQNKVLPSNSEFIKIKGMGSTWNCVFLDQAANGCLIYKTRPLECRLLFCRDTGSVEEVMGRNLLTRRELLPENDSILPLIERHDFEVSYQKVNSLLTETVNHRDAVKEQLTDLVRIDLDIRDTFLRDFPKRQQEELFLFGRPLFMVIAQAGFRLVEKAGVINLEQINT